MAIVPSMKSFASSANVSRTLYRLGVEASRVLFEVAIAQSLLRNNLADDNWVLASDVKSIEGSKRDEVLNALVLKGLLVKNSQRRTPRYQIPAFSVGF